MLEAAQCNCMTENGWSFPMVSKNWKLGKMIKVMVLICNTRPKPKPPAEKKPPGRNKQSAVGYCASRGRGRGRGGSENEASVSGMGGIDEASGGGRGGTGGRGRRGRGMESSVGGEEVVVELDEEAFRECMEEQAREQAKNDAEQERLDKERREEIEWEEKNDYFNPANFREDSLEEAPFNHTYAEVLIPSIHSQPTQQSGVWVKDTTDVTTEYVDEFLSERIAKIKEKKAFEFDKHGTGSTPDKAFDLSD
ncbi:hypothetical protein Tco_0802524 [Tanacetum coccineum]|uniref:Uncharacterized protein n=1 Tax=Tanacetum coccineum TaxID=301880 RepID=A0ABQ5A1Y5_9ASTR